LAGVKTTQHYAIFKTDMGWVGILGSSSGLLAATPPQTSAQEAEKRLGDIKNAVPSQKPFADLIKRLKAYFAGKEVEFPDKLDLSSATDFQRQVWRVTQTIPYGETRSYGWVAERLAKRGAARAVGQALARNRLPVIIPCHRVLASDGLGGYSGGVGVKESLLRREAHG
jgi:methylated-DNA-[protein]-cysteine S-methyltransferase